MRRAYIVGACRTPIGKFGGSLSSCSAVNLGALVIKEALLRANVNAADVDHVYMGCVLQAGLGQNIARQASVMAGLPYEVTAETINIVCGSSLSCVNNAASLIRLGDADIVVAGGTESMSNAPFLLSKARFGYKMGFPMSQTNLVDAMVNDGLWDSFYNCHMGITAENIVERYNFCRHELDSYALSSQLKACSAIDSGAFDSEIVPVEISKSGCKSIISQDESPRRNLSLENLSALKPSFKADGQVTAGNSSGLNDGAAAVVLVSEEKLLELNLKPLAEWCGGALAGVDPAIMGIGPVASTKKLLNKLNLSIEDIDIVESNEAFAAQALAVSKELGFDESRVNVNGGAIALGHPIGASGCRILVTLIYAMLSRKSNLGLATLCIGGGMGCSTLVRGV